ncbi:unnamed protein product [Caenorhabditis bovis]|uniref:FYVE-type domain-containing protein n=1 Tax=Caenorhabditis bovis TaxID=2654633 RepID=A0A8S1F716_9PELO|nr:unnamed protein product [Caenorhabditis bovis]
MTSWTAVNESLKCLSLDEQKMIESVLKKDLEFQESEQQRIRSLSNTVQIKKTSIAEKRRASSVAASESSESNLSSPGNVSQGRSSPLPKWNNRVCSICQISLGYILNSGTKCKKCSVLLCEKCAVAITTSGSAKQQQHLCQICYDERELSAAKNEWCKGAVDETPTSQVLLNAIRTTVNGNTAKRNSMQIATPAPKGRAPYKRNLTLPAIQTNYLNVPDEAPGTKSATGSPKFWGGSPSPRSPRSIISANSSMNSVFEESGSTNTLQAMHPREPIGSPAPRPMSSTPLTGVPEDERLEVSVPSVERRRSAFEGSRRSEKLRRQSEAPVPTFQLSMC